MTPEEKARMEELKEHQDAARELADLQFKEFEEQEAVVLENRDQANQKGDLIARILQGDPGSITIQTTIHYLDKDGNKQRTSHSFAIDQGSLNGKNKQLIHRTGKDIRELMTADAQDKVLAFQMAQQKWYGERQVRRARELAEAQEKGAREKVGGGVG